MYSAELVKIVEAFQLVNILPEISLEGRVVKKKEVNRPALQLGGFYDSFDNDRIQILGKVEEYADKLSGIIDEEQVAELLAFKERFTVFGLDLSLTPNPKEPGLIWIIPVLAFVTAMASSLYMYARQRKQNPTMAKNPTMGCMTFMSPMMSLWFTFMFPAGVGFYWIISNILSFIQQVILTNVYSPRKVLAQQMVDETVVRRSKENNTKMRIDNEKK